MTEHLLKSGMRRTSCANASKIHSLGLLMVMFSLVALILRHLQWLSVNRRIKFKLVVATLIYNTLSSSQPAYLRSLLSYHVSARSLCSSNTSLLSVPRVHTTFLPRFQHCCPIISLELASSGIRACSSSHTFVVFFKTHYFEQTFIYPSGSHKCLKRLRFRFRPTLRTIKDFTYLLTYLLTYLRDPW